VSRLDLEVFVYGPSAGRYDGLGLQYPDDALRIGLTPVASNPAQLGIAVNEQLGASDAMFVAVVRRGVILESGFGAAVAAAIAADPEVDVLYSDSFDCSAGPRRRRLIVRPDFSKERLRNQNYLGEVVLYRRDFLLRIGGLSEAHFGAEDYELALRASREARSVARIAHPLYSVATAAAPLDTRSSEAIRDALEEHLSATGGGVVRAVGDDGVHDTRRLVTGEPLVSIVIPTRGLRLEFEGDRRSFVLDAVRSIVDKSTYSNFEFVIVIDDVADADVVQGLRALAGDRLNLVTWTKPFNFSEKMNSGAVHANGEFLLMLNDDVEVLTPDWIEALLSLAQLPNAGMSGAMLYYGDDTIQHAGHAYYEGDASHIGLDAPRGDPGPLNGYRVEREVSGVTAACAMVPATVFHEAGGFSTLLPGNFNDVDLCMKIAWLGYDIYWTPHAELYHFESKTRDASVHEFEVDIAWGRWGFRMHDTRFWPYPHTRVPVQGPESSW
jgi:GT2 family glycosyltransferase